MTSGTEKKKVAIVFEDTGSGHFEVGLVGLRREQLRMTRGENLSPAEWWGAQMFNIVMGELQKAGVVKSVSHPKVQ